MAYIMCKWCYGTGFATPTNKCQWCYGTGCDRQATEKAGMAPPTGFVPTVYTFPMPTPKPLPTYRAGELDKMPDNHFSDLALRVKRELERRTAVAERELAEAKRKAITPEDRQDFHNFLTGVAHAMACRQALRMSKGHTPFGKTPQSGEMWTVPEGAELDRQVHQEVGALRTNPISWGQGDLAAWIGPRLGRGIDKSRMYANYNRSYGY